MSAPEGGARRGRPPKGSALVEGLDGSEHARERLKLILDTVAGKVSVEEACRELDISEARFHSMRNEVLQAGLGRLEPGPIGRPPKHTEEESAELSALKKENLELKIDLQASRLREEIAIAMPHLLKKKATDGFQKKNGDAGGLSGPVARQEHRHVERMKKAWTARNMAKSRRRGPWPHYARRRAERAIRKGAVAFLRWAAKRGKSREDVAAKLGVNAGTVGTWLRKWTADRMKLLPLGRTACQVEGEDRWQLMALFHLVGPEIGIQPLHGLLPHLSRRALEDILHRYRRLYRKDCRDLVYALRWTVPGTVWAIDWFEPALPIDGIYYYVLLVRDLASGETIEALPCHTKDGHMAADIVAALCRQFGAPLVVKSDNEFDCEPLNRVLAGHKVVQLLSPPAHPQYNGSIEAGVGAIRPRAQHESIRNNRPGEWTCDDVEGARCRANQTARPLGHLRPTPDFLWQNRQPPSPETRASFRRAVAQLQPQAKLDVKPKERTTLTIPQRAAARRLAISRALVDLGFLRFRRKRFSQPISSQKLANIS